MGTLSPLEVAERIGLALLAGALLGLERERGDRLAGVRTYALACEGAALFMIVGLLLGTRTDALGRLAYDPARVAAGVAVGVGFLAFLAAGAVAVTADKTLALTTAALLWVAAAVGLLIGAGFFTIAFACVAVTVAALVLARWVERRLRGK